VLKSKLKAPPDRSSPPVQLLALILLPAVLVVMAARSARSAGPSAGDETQLVKTLRRIFASEEFKPRPFGPAEWLAEGNSYTTLEPPPSGGPGKDIVGYDCATGRREALVAASQLVPKGEKAPLKIEGYAWSKDMNRVLIFTDTAQVWRLNTRGDYWVLDRKSGRLRKLGRGAKPSTLMFAKFSPDGSRVAYVRENNIYVEDLATGKIIPLTSTGSETTINGTSDWVYEEELFLRDAYRWSPDGRFIAYWQFDTRGVRDFPLLYNTGRRQQIVSQVPYPQFGVYPQIQHYGYPEPGTTNSAVRVGVVSASGGVTRWMRVPGDPRDNYIARMEWTDDSRELVIEHLNRLQNTNDVLLANPGTGAVKQIFRDQDKAWVDFMQDIRWLPGGKGFLWLSERDGWGHAYAVPRGGENPRLLTPGAYDVISLEQVDARGEWLYFLASPDNATEKYLYRTRINGSGAPERITPADSAGTHSYDISKNGQWAIHTHSTFDEPPTTDLVSLPDHKIVRVLEDNHELRAKVAALRPGPTEFFRVDADDGVKLDGWMIRPHHFDPARKYPLLVHVYGEPASQTVLNAWGGDRTLFHYALANEGYIVMSVDNRGTPAPRGRDWRKVIYGSVGVLSSKEQAAALVELERQRPYIDSARVAVWGWSGGGTNTLNLMFRSPNLYKVGMAVASVPDQRLYDTIYQERYMGLPADNAEGYRQASAINFAEGLRGSLLIVHGSGDDNVHYQGAELLVNRLIELGKQFDFMEYPNRTHSISEGKGTSLHLHELLARYLKEHLPPDMGEAKR
jgi:dipeptidyl-peptidase-4